jgi:hypothetical protein
MFIPVLPTPSTPPAPAPPPRLHIELANNRLLLIPWHMHIAIFHPRQRRLGLITNTHQQRMERSRTLPRPQLYNLLTDTRMATRYIVAAPSTLVPDLRVISSTSPSPEVRTKPHRAPMCCVPTLEQEQLRTCPKRPQITPNKNHVGRSGVLSRP